MNIIQIQNDLKNVSDQSLINYVQNPSAQVPSFLALGELNRRKEMRADYAKNNPPKSTVAQDLEQSSAPQGLAMLAKTPVAHNAPPPSQGVADLPTGDMFNEASYATGGIVAFADNQDQPVSSNMPSRGMSGDTRPADDYGIEMPVTPTWDDLTMDQTQAYKQFGVDPDFYKNQAAKLQQQRDELAGEKSEAGWMGLTRAGLGIASGKSPYALSNIGEGATQGLTQYIADIKDIKAQDRLLKDADLKLAQAQQADARGDARAAMKLMDDRKNILLNAQLKRAEIGIKDKIAAAKATGDNSKAEALLKYHAAQLGEQKFINAYPSGSVSGYLGDNQALTEFIRNKYTKNMEDYLRTGVLKEPPKEADLKKEFEATYPQLATPGSKPGSKTPVTNKPSLSTRPANIENILNKYPAPGENTNPKIRATNTPEELNTPWDLAGQGLEDQEE